MTSSQSNSRLWLYVFISFMGVIVPDWSAMVNATGYEWSGLIMKATLAAAISLRAYIDKSPAEVRQTNEILPDGFPPKET